MRSPPACRLCLPTVIVISDSKRKGAHRKGIDSGIGRFIRPAGADILQRQQITRDQVEYKTVEAEADFVQLARTDLRDVGKTDKSIFCDIVQRSRQSRIR